MKRLGERIKLRREGLQLQLNMLAKKVGISPSALSQIEKGKALPSITNLKLIANNLHTTVGQLIGENDALSSNPLIHFEEMQFTEENDSGCTSFLLSNHGSNKQMDTLLLKFPPGSNSKDIVRFHPGETFLFVLDGEITMELDGQKYSLVKHDCFYFNSNRSHLLKNNSQTLTQIILVSTPPAN